MKNHHLWHEIHHFGHEIHRLLARNHRAHDRAATLLQVPLRQNEAKLSPKWAKVSPNIGQNQSKWAEYRCQYMPALDWSNSVKKLYQDLQQHRHAAKIRHL